MSVRLKDSVPYDRSILGILILLKSTVSHLAHGQFLSEGCMNTSTSVATLIPKKFVEGRCGQHLQSVPESASQILIDTIDLRWKKSRLSMLRMMGKARSDTRPLGSGEAVLRQKKCSEYRREISGKSGVFLRNSGEGQEAAKPAAGAGFAGISMSWERAFGQNLNLVRLPIPPLPHCRADL
jgi:hypothetical protein